jgi:hypothetical protein
MFRSLLIFFCLLSITAWAQESRGTIRGRVTDPSGAPVVGAAVEATNVNTGVAIGANTNQDGNYEVPYLLIGNYKVAVRSTGFRAMTREGIELRVNDHVIVDFSLALGAVSDSITVTGDAPLIDTASSTLGAVVDSKNVTELPNAGGNAYYMERFAPGVIMTGGHAPGNPTQDFVGGAFITAGVRPGHSDALVDGVTAMANGASTYMVPPQDMVEEFRVQTSTYDASAGRSAGAVVNLTTKSGGNTPHGTAYFLYSPIRAVPWFQEGWLHDPTTGPITPAKITTANPPWLYMRWDGTLSGPVVIPRLYNGRNKTFWSAGYEGMEVKRQQTSTGTFPTAPERQGDFSQLLTNGSAYQIYDPASAVATGNGHVSRTPFPNNIVPSVRISPIAQAILQYYPMPNTSGDFTGVNNYVHPENQIWKYRSVAARLDHYFSQKWRSFFRYGDSMFAQATQSFPSIAFTSYNNPIGNRFALDNVYTFNSEMLLDVRYGFVHQRPYSSSLSRGFDLSSLGFSQSLINMIKSTTNYAGVTFPAISVDQFSGAGSGGGSTDSNYSHDLAATLTRIHGNHSLHIGAEYRLYRDNAFAFGNVAPSFTFSNTYTKATDTAAGAPMGQGLAAMLLGIPSGGQVSVNTSYADQSQYLAGFVQDDWRVTSRLTVNAGLRWEYNGPPSERFNRTTGSFDFNAALPFASQAMAAYAAHPIAQIPTSSFNPNGGLTFPGIGGQPHNLWNSNWKDVAPRFGFSYLLAPKTVLRGGYGIFYSAQGADLTSAIQTGFSRATSIIPSSDNGLTFQATLANPFPNGLLAPTGTSFGLATGVGTSISYFNPHLKAPYMQRWSLNVQRELPGRTVVEIGYVGNRGTGLEISRNIDGTPNQYLSTSPVRDNATINALSALVPNPFYGIPQFAGTTLASSTVALSQLLRPFPAFTGVNYTSNDGFSWYHAMTVRVEKRLSKGFSFQTSWTYSKLMEAISYLNAGDLRPARAPSDLDATQAIMISGIYEFPVGRNRTFFRTMPRFWNALIGGWQVEASYEGQSGFPLGFGNAIFNGNLADIPLPVSQRTVQEWFNVNAGFDRISADQLASNVRTFPLRFSGVRSDGINNLDASLMKHFRISERVDTQFRFEGINALNHVQFAAPNTTVTSSAFGTVTSELGHGQRMVNFCWKVLF